MNNMILQSDAFNFGILTISDAGSKGERKDTSGDRIEERMIIDGFKLTLREILPDEKELISEKLIQWADSGEVDIILTTGGTGLGPRDVTPEATLRIIDFEVTGISEAMRIKTFDKTPMSILSRCVSGVRSGCLIINLPGSPKGVKEMLEVVISVIPHALEMIRGWRTHPVNNI